MRDDLRVGLGDEGVPLPLQLAFQIEVVLDNAVVDDDNLASAVAVGMCVLFGGTSVRGPARMADAVVAGNRIGADDLLEVRQLAGTAPEADRAAANHRAAGRVVAAVLKLAESVDENRNDVLRSDVADDPTHGR